MVAQLAGAFGKIILMMAFGFLLSKCGVITRKTQAELSRFLMRAILPANILSSAGQRFSVQNARGMAAILAVSALYYAVSLGVLSVCTRRCAPDFRGAFINLAVFANVGFIGFPLMASLYGDAGTLMAVAYNTSYQLFFFSYGLFLLRSGGKLTLGGLFGNGIIYVSLASMLLYLSPLRFPDFVQTTLNSVGGMMVPLSMILIGAEIARARYDAILKDRAAYLVSGLRLLAFPMLMALVLRICGSGRTIAMEAVLLTALPSGSLTVIAAQENGLDASFAAKAVAQNTVLMLGSLPIILLFVNFVFPAP